MIPVKERRPPSVPVVRLNPDVIVAWAAHIIRYRVTPPEGQAFVAPTVVPMRRIRTGEEWCDYKHAATLSVMVPTDKIPRYREVLRNEEPSHGPCR